MAQELHDLFVPESAWDRLRPAVVESFGGLASTARLLDLGAGTGLSMRLLAECSEARIIAVEPAAGARTALLARVADDPALTERVSVLAGAAPEVLEEISDPLDGVLCAHMIGHLDSAQRRATLASLARLLTPRAPIVITAPQHPRQPEAEVVEEHREIGELTYTVRYHLTGAKAGIEAYEVRDGERLLRAAEGENNWATVTQDELHRDAAEAGLRLEPFSPSVAILRAA